ncbi:MAG: NAD(P)-dependent oxidoreductase [Rhodoplanes sp.]|uniref:NAD(P)-dependent oxidoreductase n=1 Tax=Rhodoplanes sp. TaxID=1968906 RepID=UPI00180010EC|nr:NAD(P)-dependent oxidoreductase [Rhodoplanes sp.]NVO15231.1 NAD(P)-dependent oxidoreductase [Rhodoplanes sp.]
MQVGFIGLGSMGGPMAGHLIEGGHTLYLRDIGKIPPHLLAAGGTACATGAEVARNADVIIIMVPKTPDVATVLFGPDGVADGLSAGKTVVDMSSTSPTGTREFAPRINALGCDYLDAPVSGGDVGAQKATLSIMVGGPQDAFDRVKPLFERMGKNVTRVGGNGDGHVTKLANQIIVGGTMVAVAEALHFAARAGADPAAVRRALMGGFGDSKILDMHGQRMIERDFVPGGPAVFQLKDMRTAQDFADTIGVHLTLLPALIDIFAELIGRQGTGFDVAGVLLEIERRSQKSEQ